MRRAILVALAVLSLTASAEGILDRYGGAEGISKRYGGNVTPQSQTDIIIMNGQVYVRPQEDSAPSYAVPQRGAPMPDIGGGAIDPRTGQFYPRAGPAGYINPQTGQFIPGN